MDRAPNGLRRGVTTGTCATAGVKAALLNLLCGENPGRVEVTLPDGRILPVSIDFLQRQEDGSVRAEVVKDAGDDPDQTHRARIVAVVRRFSGSEIRFKAGDGVGTVTQPGLQIPVGEPAINPVPRQMMESALLEVLEEGELRREGGFEFEIGCVNGREIAKKTFNPRLGIEGGISILGTTGIVEPKSLAAFQASIESYIGVALGDRPLEIVFSPGNLGQKFARESLKMPLKRVVQMANFVGFSLNHLSRRLQEMGHQLETLWVVGHPGKLGKILNGDWDTHSGAAGSALPALRRKWEEWGGDPQKTEDLKTVEEMMNRLSNETGSVAFWKKVENHLASILTDHVRAVRQVRVRLFQMDGRSVGEE